MIKALGLAPLYRGSLNSAHIHGTRVRLEEASTASLPDSCTAAMGGHIRHLVSECWRKNKTFVVHVAEDDQRRRFAQAEVLHQKHCNKGRRVTARAALRGRHDVLVDPQRVGRIVFALHRCRPG